MGVAADRFSWLAEQRDSLERSRFPDFLARQRWFGGKGRKPFACRIVEAIPWPAAATLQLILEVEYSDGSREQYHIPIAHRPIAAQADAVVAELDDGVLVDATADADFVRSLYQMIAAQGRIEGSAGSVQGCAFQTTEFNVVGSRDVRRLGAEQSNSNVRLGNDLLIKIVRRIVEGPNPDVEVGRFLAVRTTFRRIVPVLGVMEYSRNSRPPAPLAVITQWIPHEADGWTHALRRLDAFLARVRQYPTPTDPDLVPTPDHLIGDELRFARTLGKRTAELHQALASVEDDLAFRPEPFTLPDLRSVEQRVSEHWKLARDLLSGIRNRLDAETRALADRFLRIGPAARPIHLPESKGVDKIRVHGDYHLGQVLWTGNDVVIIDFEGEPARPLDERRAKHCALKDVAGMLRSFSYAAHAALLKHAPSKEELGPLASWTRVWQAWMDAAFLQQYRATADDARFVPAADPAFQSVLNLYLLDKAVYELVYELNNRPDWIGIPLSSVLALIS